MKDKNFITCRFIYVIVDFLDDPIMKMDVIEWIPYLGYIYNMLPLEDGTVLVYHIKDDKHHVSRLSIRGDVNRNLITTHKPITGFILMSNNECLILYKDGSLQRVRIEDGQVLGSGSGYKVPDVGELRDGIRIDDDQVMLVDYNKGEILTYNMQTRNKHVVIDKLSYPTSVDKAVTDQGVLYIVSEEGAHTVRVYNDRLRLVRSIGGYGGDDGRLKRPHAATVLPDNTIIVSDFYNHRISRFTIQGEFIDHIIKQSDGITYPDRLAVQYPYVWVAYDTIPFYSFLCYQIYK